MGKTITIEIDEAGNSTVDLDGFEGQGCKQVLDAFQQGDLLVAETNKAEYYKTAVKQQQKVGR